MSSWRERFEQIANSKKAGVACDHSPVITSKQIAGGGVQFVDQCLICGHQTGGPYRHKTVARTHSIENIRAFDKDLREVYRERQLQTASEEWWDTYGDYLDSGEWRDKRAAAIARSGGKCEHCGATAEVVHHKTYANVGDEPQADLAALCNACHEAEHSPQ